MNKQETLEEAAENYNLNTINAFGDYKSFIDGAKWQRERMYSEEDLKNAYNAGMANEYKFQQKYTQRTPFRVWFEQFKKK